MAVRTAFLPTHLGVLALLPSDFENLCSQGMCQSGKNRSTIRIALIGPSGSKAYDSGDCISGPNGGPKRCDTSAC